MTTRTPDGSRTSACARTILSTLALPALLAGAACDRPGVADADGLRARAALAAPAPATAPDATASATASAQPRPDAPARAPEVDGSAVDEPVEGEETEEQMWRAIEQVFGRKGEAKDGVYRLVTPRSDLLVTLEGRDVPTGAFLESDFRFWRCPCGKILVNGQFALADFEANDVVDELQENRLDVVTIAPLLLHEHPRLLMVRFQGEGRTREVAEALKSALGYTGEARNAPQPIDLSPPPPAPE